jgi:superfamily II DNA or RNA helicase
MPAPTLRPYQVAQLDAIVAGLEAGSNRLLVKSPTGTGKTVTFAAMLKHPPIVRWLAEFPAGDRKMLIIAHREELLDQAAAKIRAANPHLIVTIDQGQRRASVYADVIIASIQTLSACKFRRLERLISRVTFRIVVVDEAHHAAARTYRTALVHLGFLPNYNGLGAAEKDIEAANYDDVVDMEASLSGWDGLAPKDRLLLGMTATPNRSDAIGLGCVFQSIAYSYALKDAIADGWLVPITPWSIETSTSLDEVHLARGDFNQRELADTVNNERRNELAVASWLEHARGLATLAFTVDVAHAHALAAKFNRYGINAAAVSGDTPKDERRSHLADFQAGHLDVLCNCMVLTEGTDLPRAACILHAKPTKSATLYEQMTGRGLRLFPGKAECVVIDLVDVARKHSLQTAPVLYGLPPALLAKGQTLEQLSDGLEELINKQPGFDIGQALDGRHLTLAALQAAASTFDIWTIPELGSFGVGRVMNWIKVDAETYRLRYPWADGTEVLQVSKDLLGKWEVVITLSPRDHAPKRQRTLATGILFEGVAGEIAERFLLQDRRAVMKLKDREASWRSRPASDKQLALLMRLRVPLIPKDCTMGAASDLIDLAQARRAR